MVKNIKYFCCLIFFAFLCGKIHATHIVGGEMLYDKLNDSTYRITLKVYRDCINGLSALDGTGINGIGPAYITVYNGTQSVVGVYDVGAPVVSSVPPSINNPCIQTPNNVCVEQGVYTYTLTLPPKAGGYYIIYQRCCRNLQILNVSTSGNNIGSTYFTFIPGPETVLNNNSPRFKNLPAIFLCNGVAFTFDHSAIDPDGDQLVYSICAPYEGLDGCCASLNVLPSSPSPGCPIPPSICPTAASPPPYTPLTFIPPYTSSYPISSSPVFSIDPTTGILNGTPNLNGNWVFGICVQEFRNNQLINTHYRDFQVNVVTCSVSVVAAIADQSQNCIGQTITFTNTSVNQSINPNYFWNFGDPNTLGDTAVTKNVSYTYQDTGIYNVILIVNKGGACSDTIKKQVYVYPPLKINFTHPNVYCVKSNSVNFSAGGVFITGTTFNWSFPSANPSSSTSKNPTGIQFQNAGLFFVKLKAKQFACVDSFIDSIRILNRPVAKINNFPVKLCDPGTVAFSNGSISEYPSAYEWHTSDGAYYYQYQPSHTFSPAGIYSVTLTMYRGLPCIDTSLTSFSSITVNPLPTPGFNATPSVTSIFDPEITIQNTSDSSVITCSYDFGDGFSSNYINDIHSYTKPGKYQIIQTVSNIFNCYSTLQKEIIILAEFRFWAPSAFTPDENNLNEIYTPVTIGVSNYKFTIFDKWGHQMFETTEPNKGWDGKIKGVTCKQDVYVWKATFINDVTEKTETRTGIVTLLNDSGEF